MEKDIVEERLKQNSEIFTQTEWDFIKKNTDLVKKIYGIGILDGDIARKY